MSDKIRFPDDPQLRIVREEDHIINGYSATICRQLRSFGSFGSTVQAVRHFPRNFEKPEECRKDSQCSEKLDDG